MFAFEAPLEGCKTKKKEREMLLDGGGSEGRNYNYVTVERDPVETSFEKWARPGHFYKRLAKGPRTTSWIWNIHADAHDFDCQTTSAEEISRRVFSAHFGQLSVIFLWIGGMYFHGARFSNYSAWLADPTVVLPSSHVVWGVVSQDILNGDVGGNFSGIRVVSGWFQLWRSSGIVNESQLYWTAIAALFASATMLFAGWFHFHRFAPTLSFFQDSWGSMLAHHLGVLLGLGCLSWSGHQVHISLPVNRFLDAGISPSEIPLPDELLFNRELLSQLYPSFGKGLLPLFTLDWAQYGDILTFKGGLNPVTGSLWLTDIAHHHLSVSLVFILLGCNGWGTFLGGDVSVWDRVHDYNSAGGYSDVKGMKCAVNSAVIPQTYETNKGVYEILATSLHAQLSLNLAMMGSISIMVSNQMWALPPYPYIAVDYPTQLSLFTHHMWIGGFLIVGAGAHASIFMVRDYDPVFSKEGILNTVIEHRDAVISHLNWVCMFLGFHSFGLYCHNDTMRALSRPGDCFGDGTYFSLSPDISIWVRENFNRLIVFNAAGSGAGDQSSYGNFLSVGGKIAAASFGEGTADFMVYHVHAFTIHVTVLVLLKGVLFARNSRLISDKFDMGFRFPCDGPGRGGTCQVSGWDHVFLGLFWMYNSISVVIFHFSWKLQSDVWGVVSDAGKVSHISAGNFGGSAITVNGWLRDYLWGNSLSVISSYGGPTSAYGLTFLGGHFVWAFSLMFLFSGRGYWQELIESIVWAHDKLDLGPTIAPRALSITQGRAVGLAHYLLGGIGVTWSFFLARILGVS
jgi:photosystem I P700 chlorophyll a apoprotein A1